MAKVEIVYCGRCYKRFSGADWSKPAEALRTHYVDGSCPKAVTA